jgi:GH15 family glucan-1,4-alpha-glucosidase
MPCRRIEEYALIGDCETAALVSLDGAIDWLCWPNFSSPACFAALVGAADNGHWTISPAEKIVTATRQYRPHTLILETTIVASTGTVLLTDFMPIRGRHSYLVRIVQCTAGTVAMHVVLCPRFDYGSTVPWVHTADSPEDRSTESRRAWTFKAGPHLALLRCAMPLTETSPGSLTGDFHLSAGESESFALTYGCSFEDTPAPIHVEQALRETESFWTEWAGRSKYRGPYSEAVERSLITLKAMTYRPSGGIVAAPTTSLPERVGGPLNWDYRYCWIRDATFTISALLKAGYTEEVVAWKGWLLRAVGRDASQVQIMYGIGGERHIADWEVPWLSGYEGSTPVHVGNVAQKQTQQDIYGEIAAALFQAREAGVPCVPDELELQQALTEHLAKTWKEPGSGMWEERDQPERFTYSGVMAWLTLDLGIGSIEHHGMGGPLEHWKTLRNEIRAYLLEHGFNRHLDSFVAHRGSQRLDASVLLLPVVGFLAADDPRMLGTVKALEKGLLKDGLLLRNLPKTSNAEQGAFLACSFWLVEVYAMSGRTADARTLFEMLLTLANDVGLLSEEYDTGAKRLVGNFPQAFSHIALVRAAIRLAG